MIRQVSLSVDPGIVEVAKRIRIPTARIKKVEIEYGRGRSLYTTALVYTLAVMLFAVKIGYVLLVGLFGSLALWWWARKLSEQAVISITYEKEPNVLKNLELMISESHDEGEKAAEELLEKFHENGATKVRLVRNRRA